MMITRITLIYPQYENGDFHPFCTYICHIYCRNRIKRSTDFSKKGMEKETFFSRSTSSYVRKSLTQRDEHCHESTTYSMNPSSYNYDCNFLPIQYTSIAINYFYYDTHCHVI